MILLAQLIWLLFNTFEINDGALFGMNCIEHEDQLSEWSQCIIPHGDLADVLTNFLKSVKNFGCKLPPRKLLKFGLNFLRNNSENYLEHPLYKRITTQNCGKCGRRIRCCKRSKSFLGQAYESKGCEKSDAACIFDRLSHNDLGMLKEMYPDVAVPLDGCNISNYVAAELKSLSQGPAYQYVEPLLCQVLGTRLPTVNCAPYENRCYCCCFSYIPTSDGKCLLAKDALTKCSSLS